MPLNLSCWVEIGQAPAEEPCAQVGEPDYALKARRECRRFISLIRRARGEEPVGAKLMVRESRHDFGTYYEVVCRYDPNYSDAQEYAYGCEASAPPHWDAEALADEGL